MGSLQEMVVRARADAEKAGIEFIPVVDYAAHLDLRRALMEANRHMHPAGRSMSWWQSIQLPRPRRLPGPLRLRRKAPPVTSGTRGATR